MHSHTHTYTRKDTHTDSCIIMTHFSRTLFTLVQHRTSKTDYLFEIKTSAANLIDIKYKHPMLMDYIPYSFFSSLLFETYNMHNPFGECTS